MICAREKEERGESGRKIGDKGNPDLGHTQSGKKEDDCFSTDVSLPQEILSVSFLL